MTAPAPATGVSGSDAGAATMQACLCHQFGAPDTLGVETVSRPDPRPGEVLVKIAAASVNYADLLMVAGRYQVKPPLPFIAGLEFSGTVAALGPEAGDWQVGDRVMGAPPMGGCFAEYIGMPGDRLFAAPAEAEMPLEAAAGLLIGYGTAAYSLIERGRLKAGETVLITGAGGGVGLGAVEVGKRLGARVIAAAGSDEKLKVARAHGADDLVNYSTSDLRQAVNALTAGRGADVIVDMVGGAVFDGALRSAARWGRIVVVGFASGTMPRIAAEYLLVKNLSVLGSGFGATLAVGDMAMARATITQLLAMNKASPLKIEIADRMTLAQVPRALQLLADRKISGKLIVVPGKDSTGSHDH